MRAFSIVAIVCIAAAPPALAQGVLTEDSFLAPFDAGHRAAQALTEDLTRAEAARRRAGTLENPTVSFEQEAPRDSPTQNTWTAAWTPPLDGRLGLAREAADAGLRAARERFAGERIRLRRELRRVYADWVLASERRDALQSQQALVDGLAEQAKRRAEAGEESGVGARRLELASAEIGAQLAIAEAEEIQAGTLARAWRPDLPAGVRLERPPLEAAPTSFPEHRPELEALRLEIQRAELEGRLARRFVVFPELQAGWQTLTAAGVSRGGPVFGVSWSVPLFDRFQADRLEADQRKTALEARLTLAGARLQAELEAARSSYAALAGAARVQTEVRTDSQRIVDGVTASFRAGESSVTDLLETLRSVRDARLREIDLYGRALEAQRALEASTSVPDTSEVPR